MIKVSVAPVMYHATCLWGRADCDNFDEMYDAHKRLGAAFPKVKLGAMTYREDSETGEEICGFSIRFPSMNEAMRFKLSV